MAACPAHQLASEKQHFLISNSTRHSVCPAKTKWNAHHTWPGEGNTRISLDKPQGLSPAGERPLAGEQRRQAEGQTSWVGNQQCLLSFKLLHGLSTNPLYITVIPEGGYPTAWGTHEGDRRKKQRIQWNNSLVLKWAPWRTNRSYT